jgi:L-threonylcarbamoyladenylate synthase
MFICAKNRKDREVAPAGKEQIVKPMSLPRQTLRLDAISPDRFTRSVSLAARLLRAGGVVAFPTETVYGLGADALNSDAIAAVFTAKGRPSDNPMIVHVATVSEIDLCGVMDERSLRLARAFMPGPLTLVIPAHDSIPSIARAGLPTVAVRVPAHPVAAALLARSGPLVAPSANLSGRPSPTTAQHVCDDLNGRIAAVLDGGPCQIGIESTVVDVSGREVVILRPGYIGSSAIEQVLGEKVLMADADSSAPRAPGMKYRHYAPSIPVRLIIASEPPQPVPGTRSLVLTTPGHRNQFTGDDVRLLSESTLYAQLREGESMGVDEIIVFAEPGELDAGLMNRLRKAAGE